MPSSSFGGGGGAAAGQAQFIGMATPGRWFAGAPGGGSFPIRDNNYAGALFVLPSCKVDAAQLEVVGAGVIVGGGTYVARLGIYKLDALTGDATLVSAPPTIIDLTTTGVKTVGFPVVALDAGVYAIGLASQPSVAPTTQASFRSGVGSGGVSISARDQVVNVAGGLGGSNFYGIEFQAAGVLPTTAAASTFDSIAGYVTARVALRLA